MSPLTAHLVANFRNRFDGTVAVARDYEDSAVVLAIPNGCDPNGVRAFLDSFPPGGVRLTDMPWRPATERLTPMLVHIDPAANVAATAQ